MNLEGFVVGGALTARHAEELAEEFAVDRYEHELSDTQINFTVAYASDRSYQEGLHEGAIDELTQLPNRKIFAIDLRRAIARAKRDAPFGLGFFDLDHLKKINDKLGHDTGDQYIKTAANGLVQAIRAADAAYRVGGDELAVIFQDVGSKEMEYVQKRVMLQTKNIFEPLGLGAFKPRMSCGFAHSSEHQTLDGIEKAADTAMYEHKARKTKLLGRIPLIGGDVTIGYESRDK